MRILMVCLGNICRSPMAEGVLRHKVKQHGLNWTVDSAGTESYHVGEPPHRLSQKVCSQHGIDISGQRARRFTAADFSKYDKIYALAEDIYDEIRHIGGSSADMSKVHFLMGELHTLPNSEIPITNSITDVPDPYYGGEEGYHYAYELIDKTCEAIIARYKK